MTHDIAVAGCGPGGLATALMLHRQGQRVTLFERFGQPRPVGSGLLIQPSGLAILDALDLADPIRSQGARIDFLKGLNIVSGRRALDVDYRALAGDQCAYGVHRALLFDTLYAAVQEAGIEIRTSHQILAAEAGSDGRMALHFEDRPPSRPFDCLVDALGARSPLAPECGRDLPFGALWATLDWPDGADFLPDTLDQRYRAAREMAGVLPIGTNPATGRSGAAFFWSLRADELDAFHQRGLAGWREDVLALWPETESLLSQITSTGDLVFAHYAHRTVARPTRGRLVHLGDAWHSTSPQLGQGANMALLDAAALSQAFARYGKIEDALGHFVWLRKRHIQLYQALSQVFTPLYQADDAIRPFVRDQLVHFFAWLWPARKFIAALVSGALLWPLRAIGLGHSARLP